VTDSPCAPSFLPSFLPFYLSFFALLYLIISTLTANITLCWSPPTFFFSSFVWVLCEFELLHNSSITSPSFSCTDESSVLLLDPAVAAIFLSALFIITCGNKLGLWIYGLSRRHDHPSSDINTDTDDTDTDTNITNRLDTQPLDPRHQRGDGGDGNNNTNNVILSNMEQQNSISTRKAILFPVVGAVILMLLFFFLDILIWLFIVLVSISAFFSISFLAYAPLQALLETRLAFKVLPVRWIPRAISYVSLISTLALLN
jgi:hypothetical protein